MCIPRTTSSDQLTQLGFQVDRKPFDFTFFDEAAPVRLIVGDQQWSGADWLHAMLYPASGNVSGVLESVRLTPDGRVIDTGGCDPADWADFVAGHVALVASGPCLRRDQVVNAQNAGAVGLISLYPSWEVGQTRRPTLLDPAGITIPAIVAGGEPTEALLSAAAAGGIGPYRIQRHDDAGDERQRPRRVARAERAGGDARRPPRLGPRRTRASTTTARASRRCCRWRARWPPILSRRRAFASGSGAPRSMASWAQPPTCAA